MNGKYLFRGLLRVIAMRSRRDAISLILLGITSFLCLKHCIADAGFSAVIIALIANGYFNHKEKMCTMQQQWSANGTPVDPNAMPTAPPPTVMQTVVDVARGVL
ncbi:MAG TPA: hypothetical protein VII94_03535 [Candidatus Saccharimonadales bacterium]